MSAPLEPHPSEGDRDTGHVSDVDARVVEEPGPADAAALDPLPPRHRLAYWTAVLVALGMIGGGGYLAATAYLEETSPRTVAEDYLAAVARGDASAALAYGELPTAETELVTADMLELQRAIAPMSGVEVVSVVEREVAATVEYRYELGFESGPVTVEDTLELVRTDRTWGLARTAVPLVMRLTNAASRATVDGALVPEGPVLLFPGALPIDFDTDNLELDDESRVVRFANDDVQEDVELSAAGEAAIGAALDLALAQCLEGSAETQTLCPLPSSDARAVPGSLRGTVTEPASETAIYQVQSNPEGRVFISAEIEVAGEYAQLDFNNQRVQVAGPHTLRVLASAYATAPDVITWAAP